MEKQPITKAKLALIEKILKANLTKEEIQSVTEKAKNIIAKRS